MARPPGAADRRRGGRRRPAHWHARDASCSVVYLATAPKSNRAYVGIEQAISDVRAGKIGRVPKHLRDAHYSGAKRLGHGKGYLYAHDSPHGIAPQQYLPDELEGTAYYAPSANGFESRITERLEQIRAILNEHRSAGVSQRSCYTWSARSTAQSTTDRAGTEQEPLRHVGV